MYRSSIRSGSMCMCIKVLNPYHVTFGDCSIALFSGLITSLTHPEREARTFPGKNIKSCWQMCNFSFDWRAPKCCFKSEKLYINNVFHWAMKKVFFLYFSLTQHLSMAPNSTVEWNNSEYIIAVRATREEQTFSQFFSLFIFSVLKSSRFLCNKKKLFFVSIINYGREISLSK